MKTKHLKIIGALVGIAALLYLPRLLSNEEGRGSVDVESGFSFSISEPVTRVDVTTLADGASLRLERGEEVWTVDELKVDMSKIESLLETIRDLTSSVIVARNPDNHDELSVSGSTGRRVDVYTEAGGPYSFHLGDRDVRFGGYFVRSPEAPEVFRLEGAAGGYLSRDRDGWRDRVVARTDVETIRDLVIRRANEGEIVIRREDEAWLVDGVGADSLAVANLLGMLPALSTSSFPTDAEAAAADFSTPDAELDVFAEGDSDVTGRDLVLSLRFVLDAEAGDWLVRTADGDEVYRLAAYAARRLLPERSELLPE
jgi:hypothetical protein